MLEHKLLYGAIADVYGKSIFKTSDLKLILVDTVRFNTTVQAIDDELKSHGITSIPKEMVGEIEKMLKENLVWISFSDVSKTHDVKRQRQIHGNDRWRKETSSFYNDVKNKVIDLTEEIGQIPFFDYDKIIKL